MGHHKKRATATATTTAAAAGATAGSQQSSDSPANGFEDSSSAAIKNECEKALNALRRGNHNKALRLMKECGSKYDNSAFFHRVNGMVAVKVSAIMDDPNAKQRHYRNAIESARKAVVLSPKSIEFAHFYASVLFDAASDGKDYEEVVAECDRALAIDDPIDPLKDNMNICGTNLVQMEDKSELLSSPRSRIAQMHVELRGLIQKANIASISSWMKNLGGPPGEERFRLIPLRKFGEDPLDSRYFSTNNTNVRRPNEIKKATKTPEERRKEIEVRVAAARLLQQKSEQGESAEEAKVGSASQSTSLGLGNGVSNKAGERRRHGSSRRNSSFSERKDQVGSFWNSLSFESKKKLLNVTVSDLKAHFSGLSNKDGRQVWEILSEALQFGAINKSWKFWACCRCGEKFTQAGAHGQHVVQEHMGILFPKVQSSVPRSVDNEWVEMLLGCSWKPLDLTASVRMLEDQSKPVETDFFGEKNHKEQMGDDWSEWVTFPENKSMANGCNGSCENRGDDGVLNIECKSYDGKEGSKVYSLPNSWPISDDIERTKLLEKISSLFQMLLRHKCLAMTHVQWVIHFTMEELQGLFPGSQILSSGIDQAPLCICFLGAMHLKKIVNFLQEVCHACGVAGYPEKVTFDDTSNCSQASECEERILLNEDASSLLLDESLLNSDGMITDDGSGNTVALSGKGVQSGCDSFMSWIYAGSSSGEQLAAWCRLQEERSQQGMEVLLMLEKEFCHLQNLCDRKYEHLAYEEALQGLEELWLEESKKREHIADFSHCSYDSLLRRRRDELGGCENENMFVSNKMELDAITNVLRDAESLTATQFGYEETYGGETYFCDLEAGEDDWRSKDHHHQVDSCIEMAIQKQKEHMSVELCKNDARILRSVTTMQQLELKLEPVSFFDYHSILLPLVKSYMRAHIEDLAEKDATEKSDAAREAFLAELDLDSKKGTGIGNDNPKQFHDKLKDKKKNKDSKRNKDFKVGSFNVQLESSEQFSHGVISDSDHDLVALESGDNVKELEKEFRRKIELEAEERKLEETLEYQRQLENQAKQKLLAAQYRNNGSAASQYVEQNVGDVALLAPGFSVGAQCKQDQQALKNGTAENIDGLDRNLKNGSGVGNRPDECDRSARSYLKQGSSDGETANSALPCERRSGRKGKRRSSSKLPEGRHQAICYGQDNEISGNPVSDVIQKDKVWNKDDDLSHNVGNGGSKTLRQLQAEEDEEERFQADLKKAVRQSLDTFQARHQKVPSAPTYRMLQQSSQNCDSLGTGAGGMISINGDDMDSIGAGLQNEIGEYNCFLNVIIQSLWHLKRFREELLRRSPSEHIHLGAPCVVCALVETLTALSLASEDSSGEPVAPTKLRIALSNLYPDSNFFQEGQMNDASEVLEVIFDCLHRSFISGPEGSVSELGNKRGDWDCSSPSCIAHSLFGMNIFERMDCPNCGVESRHLNYTTFFHNINASALRTMKATYAEKSFDELLNVVEMSHQLACALENNGCGQYNHIHHFLSDPPHIFTTVLGWQNTCESVDNIRQTLAALATEIDISVLYRGLRPKNVHRLVSVVCYYGQHYHCFAYSHDRDRWIMYDDKTVKVIGTWAEVLSMCERGHLQPQVLFYEATN